MIYFSLFLFILNVAILMYLWRQEAYKTYVILTPFLVFSAIKIIFVWSAALYTYWNGIVVDSYPMFTVASSFSAYLLGFACFCHYKRSPYQYAQLPVVRVHQGNYYFTGIIFCGALLIFLGIYRYQGLPATITIVRNLLANNYNLLDIAEFTSENRLLATKAHWYGESYRGNSLIGYFSQVGWPYLVGVSILMFYTTRKQAWLVVVTLLLFLSFIFITGDSTRGPFLWFLVTLLVLVSLIKPLSIKFITFMPLILFLLFMGLSFTSKKAVQFLGTDNPVMEVADLLILRLMANGYDDIMIIEFTRIGLLQYEFAEEHLRQLISAIPGVQYGTPLAYKLWLIMNPFQQGTTFATPTYLGVAYVDFGIVGTLIVYFLVGISFGIIQSKLLFQTKNIDTTVLTALVIVYLGKFAVNGPIGFATNLLLILATHTIFKVCATIFSFRTSRIPVFRPQQVELFPNNVPLE